MLIYKHYIFGLKLHCNKGLSSDASCSRGNKIYFGMLISSVLFSKQKGVSVQLPWECTSEQSYMQSVKRVNA